MQTIIIEPTTGPIAGLTPTITVLRTTVKGFIAAGTFGSVDIFEKSVDPNLREDMYYCTFRAPLAEGNETVVMKSIAVSGTEASLILQTDMNVLYRVQLSGIELKIPSDIKFEHILPPFHHGSIIGLDVCARKPLLVSCSTDRSIRIWNYLTGECELCKYFPEEASSVAIHPSGLYLLIGFGDKLRLMNVLIDDFRLFKEIGIRACRE
ncbi:UNVERIFIED_CONTAM: Cilia- and flagella-associated protein 57, partial [Siphonaria sp. JEL0065]